MHESPTEWRNPRTLEIDSIDTNAMLQLILAEDARAVEAAMEARESLARAVEEAFLRVRHGGTLHYFGAGASGRLAMLDTTEITPTFGAEPGLFTSHFAGGTEALTDSMIDREDAEDLGAEDAASLDAESVAIGITASGTTSYVSGALRQARRVGSLVVLVTCNPRSSLRAVADISIVADTGPEAITGSTRLKAGTATKVILNAFSTALMIKTGRTYSNLMVGLTVTNRKLQDRALAVLIEATSRQEHDCRIALDQANGELPVALVALLAGCEPEDARQALLGACGSARAAVGELTAFKA